MLLFPQPFSLPVISGILDALRPRQEEKCPDLSVALPDEWTVISNTALDTDGDKVGECLVIFRYDSSSEGVGPLGGVIYDLQPERPPSSLETQAPYRPAAYIPYQLLPRSDGLGYLGETKVETDVYDANGDGKPEVVIKGYAGYDFPVMLSVFQWVDKDTGYRSLIAPAGPGPVAPMIFADAGVTVEHEPVAAGAQGPGKIVRVNADRRIYDPPHYARSHLARRTVYVWGEGGLLVPLPDQPVVFAFGRPKGAQEPGLLEYAVMYPEAAVLAQYSDGEVLEVYAPQGDPRRLDAPVLVRVKVKKGNAQVIETWAVTRRSSDSVRDPVIWRLQPQKLE